MGADGLGPVADDLVERHHLHLEELPEAVGDGPEAELVAAARPSGRPEVRGDHERRPALAELAEGGDGRADPQVVGDPAALDRHVEVDADEDAGAGDVAEVVEGAERH